MVTVTAYDGTLNRVLLKTRSEEFDIESTPQGSIDKNPILRLLFRIARKNKTSLRLPKSTHATMLSFGTIINQREFEAIFRVLGKTGLGGTSNLAIKGKTVRYRNNMYGVNLIFGDLNPAITYTSSSLKKGMEKYVAAMTGFQPDEVSLTQEEAEQYLPYPERKMLAKRRGD